MWNTGQEKIGGKPSKIRRINNVRVFPSWFLVTLGIGIGIIILSGLILLLVKAIDKWF